MLWRLTRLKHGKKIRHHQNLVKSWSPDHSGSRQGRNLVYTITDGIQEENLGGSVRKEVQEWGNFHFGQGWTFFSRAELVLGNGCIVLKYHNFTPLSDIQKNHEWVWGWDVQTQTDRLGRNEWSFGRQRICLLDVGELIKPMYWTICSMVLHMWKGRDDSRGIMVCPHQVPVQVAATLQESKACVFFQDQSVGFTTTTVGVLNSTCGREQPAKL